MASLLARVGKDAKSTPARRSAIAGTVAPQEFGDDFFQMMDFSGKEGGERAFFVSFWTGTFSV